MKPAAQPSDPVLPRLRAELVIRPDERTPDGEPTWTVHDPVRGMFLSVDWATYEILNRWAFGRAKAIAEAVRAETTLHIEAEDVEQVAKFLMNGGFLDIRGGDISKALAEQHARRTPSFWKWLLTNYLFLRVPLVRPDRFLDWLAPKLGFLYSKFFLWATVTAALFGVFGVVRQWELFRATLTSHFSFSGATAFIGVLVVAKVLHEFGHAVTAKRAGARVSAMGVAVIVLLPMPYTDLNDVWRVGDRRKRLAVSLGGLAAELILAAWATFAWTFLPDGFFRNAAFFLGFVGWLGTVLINLSPFMRFDGYFALSDWCGIPNLHEEAEALGRWKLRRILFGFQDPMPAVAAPSQATWLIAFAWFTWVYRFTVFLGIAAVVYHFAIKIVGIVLFLIEVIWFIFMPIYRELKEWKERADEVRQSPAFYRTLLGLASVLILACVPWPTVIHSSAVLRTEEERVIYAPEASRVIALPHADGARVNEGLRLLELASEKLEQRVLETDARLRRLRTESAAAAVTPGLSDRIPVLRGQLETAEALKEALEETVARLTPGAPCDGVVRLIDPELAPGDWVAKDEPLIVVRRARPWEAIAYVEEGSVHRVIVGSEARFYPDRASGLALRMRVQRVDRDASHSLSMPMLASTAGGSVQVQQDSHGELRPVQAVYRVTLVADEAEPAWAGHDWRGRVAIRGESEIPIVRVFRYAMSIIWKEAGF